MRTLDKINHKIYIFLLTYKNKRGNMKNLKNSVLTIATMLIVIGIIISSFLTEYSSLIATITTTITAVIGAVALFIQFKKDKEINKASFLLEVSKQF